MHQTIEEQLGFGYFQRRQICILCFGVVIAGYIEASTVIKFFNPDQYILFFIGQSFGFIILLFAPFKRTIMIMVISAILMISCLHLPPLMIVLVGTSIAIINPCCVLLAGECTPEKFRGRIIVLIELFYAMGKTASGILSNYDIEFLLFISLGVFIILTYFFVFESFQQLIIRGQITEAHDQIKMISQLNHLQEHDYTQEIEQLQLTQDAVHYQQVPVKLTALFGMIALFGEAYVRMIQMTMAQNPQLISSYYISDLPCVLCAFLVIDLLQDLVKFSITLQIVSLVFLIGSKFILLQESLILLVVKIVYSINSQFINVICFRSYSHANRIKGISIFKGLARVVNIFIPYFTTFIAINYYYCLVVVQIISTLLSFLMLSI